MLAKFIETELNAYITDQRLTDSPLTVKLIVKAFEAYDEYRRLTSPPKELISEEIEDMVSELKSLGFEYSDHNGKIVKTVMAK